MFILLVFFGYNKYWAVAIFTVALTLNGAVTAGYLGNGLDIAPNFSGTIFGMANTGSSIGGYVSAWMVGELTHENVIPFIYTIERSILSFNCFQNTYGQWQIIFGIVAASYLVGSLSFLFFGKGELQPWNNPPERNGVQMQDMRQEEGVPLKTNNAS